MTLSACWFHKVYVLPSSLKCVFAGCGIPSCYLFFQQFNGVIYCVVAFIISGENTAVSLTFSPLHAVCLVLAAVKIFPLALVFSNLFMTCLCCFNELPRLFLDVCSLCLMFFQLLGSDSSYTYIKPFFIALQATETWLIYIYFSLCAS